MKETIEKVRSSRAKFLRYVGFSSGLSNRFAVAVIVSIIATSFQVAQAQDKGTDEKNSPTLATENPTQQPPQDAETNQLPNAQQQIAIQNAKKKLLEAMEKMTPQTIIVGSPLESEMKELIEKFAANDQIAVRAKLEELTKTHPELPPADFLVGALHFAAGNATAGTQYLEIAARDFPDYPSTFAGFSRIAIEQGRFADAFALSKLASDLAKNGNWSEVQSKHFRTEILDSLVDIEINRKHWDQALTYLGELRQLVPESGKVTLNLAQVHFEMDQVDKALENLKVTKTLAAELRSPEVIIAEWYLIKKNLDESKKWIERAVEENPENADVQLNYARWLLRNEQLPQAAEVAKKAEELGADQYQATFVRGEIAFSRRDYSLAEVYFSKLNQFRPGDVQASNLLTLSLIESEDQSKLDKAMQLATMNARVYPQNTVVLATLGWVLHKTGNTDQARQVFQQLVNVRPLPAATGFFLSSFLQATNDPVNAKRFLEASLEAEGFFMYRSAARDLLRSLEQTPAPDDQSTENLKSGDEKTDEEKSGDGKASDDGKSLDDKDGGNR